MKPSAILALLMYLTFLVIGVTAMVKSARTTEDLILGLIVMGIYALMPIAIALKKAGL